MTHFYTSFHLYENKHYPARTAIKRVKNRRFNIIKTRAMSHNLLNQLQLRKIGDDFYIAFTHFIVE